jgi:hypothetical protein
MRAGNQASGFGASLGSSCLLSSENGGIRQSNAYPSSRSIRKVPLKMVVKKLHKIITVPML